MPNPKQMAPNPHDFTGFPERPGVSPETRGILTALDEERREVLEAVLQALADAPEPDAVSACIYLLKHLAVGPASGRRADLRAACGSVQASE